MKIKDTPMGKRMQNRASAVAEMLRTNSRDAPLSYSALRVKWALFTRINHEPPNVL